MPLGVLLASCAGYFVLEFNDKNNQVKTIVAVFSFCQLESPSAKQK